MDTEFLFVMTWFWQHVVDAVLAIRRPNEAIDLHMVEIMEMQHKTEMDTKWVLSASLSVCLLSSVRHFTVVLSVKIIGYV